MNKDNKKEVVENKVIVWLFLISMITIVFFFSVVANAENQTGTCTAGSQYCENNVLDTTNNTTTTNTYL